MKQTITPIEHITYVPSFSDTPNTILTILPITDPPEIIVEKPSPKHDVTDVRIRIGSMTLCVSMRERQVDDFLDTIAALAQHHLLDRHPPKCPACGEEMHQCCCDWNM